MNKEQQVLIEVANLSKAFSGRKILSNISFSLHKKEVLGIVGFSGQGKSTLLNIVCGVESIDSGDINFNSITRKHSHYVQTRKKLLGYCSQDHSFYDELSLFENLEYFGTLYHMKPSIITSKIEELLAKFNLQGVRNHLASSLSEGQKKRLGLACSLIHSPEVLILDEPTANLDFKLRDELLEYLLELRSEGVSVIFVSHNLEEVEEVCDKVVLLHNQKVEVIKETKHVKKSFERFVRKNE